MVALIDIAIDVKITCRLYFISFRWPIERHNHLQMTTCLAPHEGRKSCPGPATMSTSVAHLNTIATGPSSTPQFSVTSSASTDAQRAAGDDTLGGMGEATAPLMRFLLNGRNASFFGTWYASEAVCLGMFR